jgi:Uma2 family endonuclease
MQVPATLAQDEYLSGPDHKQLPDKDGKFVTNFQEHPQSFMLTDSLRPRLFELHPDGQFCVGSDNGIYWRVTQPPLVGCKAPDWFLVEGVPPMLDGEIRRSYVLYHEGVRPLIVIEYVSGDGSEEHDTTPFTGKFWVYEQGIVAPYYAIFDANAPSLEVYVLTVGRYQQLTANAQGRFPIPQLRVELGIWEGTFWGLNHAWLRFWDAESGELLPLSDERTAAFAERAVEAEGLLDDTRQLLNEAEGRAATAEERARKLLEKLRALGIDPDA